MNGDEQRRRKAVADLIITARVKAGLTIDEAVERSGVSRTTWTAAEKALEDRWPAKADTWGPIARTLGLDEQTLLVAAGHVDPPDANRLLPSELIEELRSELAEIRRRLAALEAQADG